MIKFDTDAIIARLTRKSLFTTDENPFFQKSGRVMARFDKLVIKDEEIEFWWNGQKIAAMAVPSRGPTDELNLVGVYMETEVNVSAS